jgi:acyl carrier protein
MTNEQIKQAILQIIGTIAPDEDVSALKGDIPLRDQLALDSMDFLDIVMELRKRHRIDVPESDYARLSTLDSCVAYLAPKLKDRELGP